MASTHRKHALEKQATEKVEAERAERAAHDALQATVRAHREAIEGFEGAGDHAAVLRELRKLQKSGIDPDVLSLESAARTLGGAKQWKQAAESALTLTELGLEASEPRALGVWLEALTRRGMLRQCLEVAAQADMASHELPPPIIERAMRLAADEGEWQTVLDLHQRICPSPSSPSSLSSPSMRLGLLLPAIRAHGQLGQCRQALRLAVGASRQLTPPQAAELWVTAAEACTSCANASATGRSAARAARRILAARPAPAVAAATICALVAAKLWEPAAAVARDQMMAVSGDQMMPMGPDDGRDTDDGRDQMMAVGPDGSSIFATSPPAWDAAVASAVKVEDTQLFAELAEVRRSGGGSREAHALVLRVLAANQHQAGCTERAWDHLQHARPLDTPADENVWVFGMDVAAMMGNFSAVVDMFLDMGRRSSLSTLSAPILARALQMGVYAAVREGTPAEGVRMLMSAHAVMARVDASLWQLALTNCLEAGDAQIVIDMLIDGPASEFAQTDVGRGLLGNAAGIYVAQTLVDTGELGKAVEQHIYGPSPDLGAMGRLRKYLASVLMSEQANSRADVYLELHGRRRGTGSLGLYLCAIRDAGKQANADSMHSMRSEVPRARRSDLLVDLLSLMGFVPTPQLRESVRAMVRHAIPVLKKAMKQVESEEATEDTRATSRQDVNGNRTTASMEEDKKRGAARRKVKHAFDLIDLCDQRGIGLRAEACLMAILVRGLSRGATLPRERMLEIVEMLPQLHQQLLANGSDTGGNNMVNMTMPTYIATLAIIGKSAVDLMDLGLWSQADARGFLGASENWTTFLARCEVGTAEQRGVAYEMLGELLQARWQVCPPSPCPPSYLPVPCTPHVYAPSCRHLTPLATMPLRDAQATLYAQHGHGPDYFDGQGAGDLQNAERLLSVIRLAAADKTVRLDAHLLGRLMIRSDQSDTAGLNAAVLAFVDAGGRPSGGQLVLMSLASLGFTFQFGALGTEVSSCHNVSCLRGAWYDLKSVWQLTSRPEVARELWPELHASGASLNQILEPLQDILLLGALGQVALLDPLHGRAAGSGDTFAPAWAVDELQAELRSVLLTTSIAESKVDALLNCERDELVARACAALTATHVVWAKEGGWSLESRTFAPPLTLYINSLDEELRIPEHDAFGAKTASLVMARTAELMRNRLQVAAPRAQPRSHGFGGGGGTKSNSKRGRGAASKRRNGKKRT